jgi:uncharacterized membrane protein YkvA (DUF1232 family)
MNREASEMRAEMADIAGDVAQVVTRVPKYVRLVWLLLKDPGLSTKQRTALMAAIGYSVSPIDAVPGIIPVIGQLDDLAIVLYTARWILAKMPADSAAEYLSKSGLTAEILDADLSLVQRSGVKILKRMVKIMGATALVIWGVGKLAAKGVSKQLRKMA